MVAANSVLNCPDDISPKMSFITFPTPASGVNKALTFSTTLAIPLAKTPASAPVATPSNTPLTPRKTDKP